MAQSFFPITPVDVTPGVAGSWRDVDVSALTPVGTTGVVLHLVGTPGPANVGLRKRGSGHLPHPPLQLNGNHTWAAVGVDANRVFQCWVSSTTWIEVYLVAYTMAGVTFFTDPYVKTPGVTDSWRDVDCSVEAPGAIGLIFEICGISAAYLFGARKKGSSDNRYAGIAEHACFGVIIGCDASQVCQLFIQSTLITCYLVGYITDGAAFNTNATNLSLTTTGAWTDLNAIPSGSCMGFIEVHTPSKEDLFGLRKNDSSEDIYGDTHDKLWAFVECDSSQIIEGKIQTTADDFWLVGYAEGPAPAPPAAGGGSMAAKLIGAGLL